MAIMANCVNALSNHVNAVDMALIIYLFEALHESDETSVCSEKFFSRDRVLLADESDTTGKETKNYASICLEECHRIVLVPSRRGKV